MHVYVTHSIIHEAIHVSVARDFYSNGSLVIALATSFALALIVLFFFLVEGFFEISIYWTFLFRFCWNFQGFVNRWALLLQFLDPRLKILVLLSSCVVFENDKWISIFVCVLTRPVSTFSYTINCSQLCKHRQTHTTFLKHFSKTLSASSIMLKFNKSLIGAYTTTFLYFFFSTLDKESM